MTVEESTNYAAGGIKPHEDGHLVVVLGKIPDFPAFGRMRFQLIVPLLVLPINKVQLWDIRYTWSNRIQFSHNFNLSIFKPTAYPTSP